jgi:hypothetical protein
MVGARMSKEPQVPDPQLFKFQTHCYISLSRALIEFPNTPAHRFPWCFKRSVTPGFQRPLLRHSLPQCDSSAVIRTVTPPRAFLYIRPVNHKTPSFPITNETSHVILDMPVDSGHQLDRAQLTSSGQTTPARPLKYAGPQLWEVQIKPGRPILGVKLILRSKSSSVGSSSLKGFPSCR